ncbi:hypothetical protein BJX99DRAFT_268661 [Aspergillus californicus]
MGPVDRLQLLFAQDQAILQINTHLRSIPAAAAADPKAEPAHALSEVVENCPTCNQPKKQVVNKANEAKKPEDTDNGHTVDLASTNPHSPTGAPRPHDGTFCPLTAVSRFPYHYIRGELMQRVAGQFFDKGQFWDRPWDLYYIHAPGTLGGRALLVVPAAQVRQLLKQINTALECGLSLPSDEEKGFVLRFNRDGFPQPTFLGCSEDRNTKDNLEATIPRTAVIKVSTEASEDFAKMMEAAITSVKSKSKSKIKKQQLRVQRDLEINNTIERAQRYLGLRSETSDLIDCNWDEKAATDAEAKSGPKELTLDEPAPHPFLTEPVFISVDVEVNERCHSMVTEVGISTLDTRDLVGVALGPNGEHWQSHIQSRHLRVEEYKKHVNQLYVRGCPDKFEFGTSEFVKADDVSKIVQAAFTLPSFFDGPDKKLRPLVLVGHSLAADIEYLRLANVHIIDAEAESSKFVDQFDTATAFQMISGEMEPRSLGVVIAELGMTGWNLHNAGNDARYTMQALVAMLVKHSMAQVAVVV